MGQQDTFILKHLFANAMSFGQLKEATAEYNYTITKSDFILPTLDTLQLMLWAKREKITYGPYQNLTFFEISNRIYSDLVLLEAAQVLFKEHNIKNIQLRMSNHSGSDLIVLDENENTINGEAFNTAPSFFQIKMRSELKKYRKETAGIIAFNTSALNDKNKMFLDRKKSEYPNIVFVECKI